jgi:formamidopyrimidine-DNA glycosylase
MGIDPQALAVALTGRTLLAARRKGKHLWCELDGGSPALLLHFGMTGGIVVRGVGAAHYKSFVLDESSWPPRFWKLVLDLEGGGSLAFCDSRRFARVRFLADPETAPPLSELGWDPLLPGWPERERFAEALSLQRRAVKAVLLDQSFTAGVGNWVADEVLYQAAIHPEQPANSLDAKQVSPPRSACAALCCCCGCVF